ncbi:MAG: lipoyl synthase [Candidatus Latescibacteria bacterium]|nr:lipoyl synthase [Candidatus Latescibacterota bacterium]MBT4140193.1 lipoyl synthase [Candidatus Latescibacterota bacterium]MBT5831111.1 lipoyl synthase [Candidatus Latescibacterota bacterium]
MLLDIEGSSAKPKRRLPDWFRVQAPGSSRYRELKNLVQEQNLHTVCESARCPNIGECWNSGTATFMILGDVCTRSCGFCAVKTGRPEWLDTEEPKRVAEAVQHLGLRHAVITSVNRDELPDGGAGIFAETIREVHRLCANTSIEVLIPDFQGNWDALQMVMDAGPNILNHNLETVPRLYKTMRPQAKYERSLELLDRAKDMRPDIPTKSGIMVGADESMDEVYQAIQDLAAQRTDILTIGQYLQPSPKHVAVERFYHPDEFSTMKTYALSLGFKHVESGPLVRSSYHAADQVSHV